MSSTLFQQQGKIKEQRNGAGSSYMVSISSFMFWNPPLDSLGGLYLIEVRFFKYIFLELEI